MYFALLGSAHRKFLNEVFNKVLFTLPPEDSCKLFNIRQHVVRRIVFYYYDNNCKLYFAKEGNRIHYFFEKSHLFLYQFGLKARGISLAN